MRRNLIREGAEVMDKITGRELMVTEVEDGIGIAYPKDEEEADENRRLITEENCICFRFLRNEVKTTDIDAKVDGGVFYVDGTPLETGSLKPVAILGTIPGNVILTVASKTEGKVDLMEYNVDRDRFTTVGKALPADGLAAYPAGDILAVLMTEVLTEPDENGVAVETGTEDVLFAIGSRNTFATCEISEVVGISMTGTEIYFLGTGHAYGGKEISSSEVYLYDTVDGELIPFMVTPFIAEKITAGPQGIAVFADDNIAVNFLGTEYHVFAEGIGKAVNPYGKAVLVDATMKGNTLSITFADPDTYGTVTVQSVRTRDRGDIVTVL